MIFFLHSSSVFCQIARNTKGVAQFWPKSVNFSRTLIVFGTGRERSNLFDPLCCSKQGLILPTCQPSILALIMYTGWNNEISQLFSSGLRDQSLNSTQTPFSVSCPIKRDNSRYNILKEEVPVASQIYRLPFYLNCIKTNK